MADTLIHAYTALGFDFPPYINVTRLADGSVRVIVRTMPDDAGEGTTSAIRMSAADWHRLIYAAYDEQRSIDVGPPPGPPDGPVIPPPAFG